MINFGAGKNAVRQNKSVLKPIVYFFALLTGKNQVSPKTKTCECACNCKKNHK